MNIYRVRESIASVHASMGAILRIMCMSCSTASAAKSLYKQGVPQGESHVNEHCACGT